ncbi:MAG: PG0541 family transporter-associated protein [Candidatus Eisenbacteria bacterium]
MKMVLLNYYVGIDAEVKEILAKLDVCTYTRLPEVEGRISCGEPRENSHVWPGANSTLFAVVDDATSGALVREFESFNEGAHGEGIDAYVMEVSKQVLARS